MSGIWKYFNKAPEDKAICKKCKKEIGRKYGSTSGLWKHLQFCHGDLFKKLKEKEAGQQEEVIDSISNYVMNNIHISAGKNR